MGPGMLQIRVQEPLNTLMEAGGRRKLLSDTCLDVFRPPNAQCLYPLLCVSMMLWRLFSASPSGRVAGESLSCNSLLFRCAPKDAQAKHEIPSMRKLDFQGSCLRRRRQNEETNRRTGVRTWL